jgi:hypothetical protein
MANPLNLSVQKRNFVKTNAATFLFEHFTSVRTPDNAESLYRIVSMKTNFKWNEGTKRGIWEQRKHMNYFLFRRHNLCSKAIFGRRPSSLRQFRFTAATTLLLVACLFTLESFTDNLGESGLVIILRLLIQARRNVRLHKDSTYQLGTFSSYSFLDFPICTAFVLPVERCTHLQTTDIKIKRTSFLQRNPSDSFIKNMTDVSDLSCLEASIDSNDLNSSNRDEPIIQPLYITVGPPCAGKSTWIRRQNNTDVKPSTSPNILDICIDDQPGVYHSVPTSFFLPETISRGLEVAQQQGLSKIIFGRSIKDRISDLSEFRAVLLRFANITTKDDLQNSSIVSSLVSRVVEEIICEYELKQQIIVLPNTVDLFIMDAIFRRPPLINTTMKRKNESVEDLPPLSALSRVEHLLYDTPVSIPIAYGNTNTRATDYVQALTMALKLKRPVHFVVYYDGENKDWNQDLFDLSVENGMEGLIRRNMYRFLQTGRYVPEQVIIDMRDRTLNMINDIVKQQGPSDSNSDTAIRKMSKLEFHQQLAKIAGFQMNDERMIVAINRSSSSDNLGINRDRMHERPKASSTTTTRQRPWDRPANTVRGYDGQLNNYGAKKHR